MKGESAERRLARIESRDARIRIAIEEWATDDVAMGANPYRARTLLSTIWETLGGDGRLFAYVGSQMAAEPPE